MYRVCSKTCMKRGSPTGVSNWINCQDCLDRIGGALCQQCIRELGKCPPEPTISERITIDNITSIVKGETMRIRNALRFLIEKTGVPICPKHLAELDRGECMLCGSEELNLDFSD